MLEILGLTYNDLPPVVPVTGTISGNGATIGRGSENAIVLPDPKRLVSRQHLKFILQQGDKYLIRNISSGNPVFVNNVELAPGMECPLQDLDKILVGGYVLQVNYVVLGQISTPQSQHLPADVGGDDFLAELLGSATVGVNPVVPDQEAEGRSGIPDPFMCGIASERNDIMQMLNERGVEPGSLDSTGDELINSKDAGMSIDELLLDPLKGALIQSHGDNMDLLAMFNETRDTGAFGDILQPAGDTASNIPPNVNLTHGSDLNALFHLPSTSEKPPSIPQEVPPAVEPQNLDIGNHPAENVESVLGIDDIDSILAGLSNGSAQVSGASVGGSLSTSLPENSHTGIDFLSPVSDVPAQLDVPPESPSISPEPPSIPPAQFSSYNTSGIPDTHRSSEPSATPGMDELYRAFIEGLGMELPGRVALDKAFMNILGQVLRHYTQGTVDLIAGRTVVKQAVRASLTVIAPERNNPLKFSPDGNTALIGLFGRPMPGFMEPVEAIRNAYVDLRAHQIGVISGMQAALSHVLERFNPAMLGDSLPPKGMLENMMPVMHNARLWKEYGLYFYTLREKASDHFQKFFGEAFLEAYEKAILTVQSGERTR